MKITARRVFVIGGVSCLALLVVALLVPNHIQTRVARNQWNAGYDLARVRDHQEQYAAAHPEIGYSCDLSRLDERHGTPRGYVFSMKCFSDINGRTSKYVVTAVPERYGVSGFNAYCMTESGIVWYADDGSPANCLRSKKQYHIGAS